MVVKVVNFAECNYVYIARKNIRCLIYKDTSKLQDCCVGDNCVRSVDNLTLRLFTRLERRKITTD